MAEKLSVLIKPTNALESADSVPQALFARLRYTREVPSGETAAGAHQVIAIDGASREALDGAGRAQIDVDDHAVGTPFVVQVESGQGALLWTSADRTKGPAEFAIPNSVFEAAQRKAPTASPILARSGRFVTMDDSLPDFSAHRLLVAPVSGGGAASDTDALRKILSLTGQGEVTSFEVKRIDAARLSAAAVNALGFRNAIVRPDGAFELSIDITGDEVGWTWLLLGPQNFAGYQLDVVPTAPRPASIIMLPPARGQGNGAEPAAGDAGATPESAVPGKDGCAGHGSAVPMDYDEQQLVDHPGTFSDDPGKFCTPFENPQRILGERRFFTVLRIDQPEIGGEGSIKISRPIVLDLAPSVRVSAVAGARAERETKTTDRSSQPIAGGLSSLAITRLNLAAAAAPAIDLHDALKAELQKPVRKPWVDWVRTRSKPRAPISAANPIEWDGDPTIYQAATVAGGHILEWRVQWRSNGYSLGNVAHTLTLAPRQTKRISKISWRRRETAMRQERTDAHDALTQVTDRARDYTDAVQSSLSEWSSGGSKSRTTGVAGGIGFALGPVIVGGGAAHGSASSESWQQGGRQVAAAEQQQLRDAIRQYGESVRSLESTVVSEIAQEEDVEGVSETLRNVNYCHALSVLYYEILRHLRVDTAFAGVRECLFVPFSVTPFDVDKALKWRDKLRNGMLDTSLRWALDRLDEVATAWSNSDVPPGRRMQHPVSYVTGSIYVQLSVDRPRDQGVEEAIEAYYTSWRPYSSLFAQPPRLIIDALRSAGETRDRYFQKEVAPSMAGRWANLLQLSIGSVPVAADFTLASSYSFGGIVRIDFTAAVDGAFNREQMQQMVVRSSQPLPPGSVANLTRMSLHYHTDHFDREVGSDQGARDLIAIDSGLPDPAGAIARFGLSAWEREDLRAVIEDAVDRLIVHLNANLLYYCKVVWWLFDRDELYMMLDGFTAPYGRRFENGAWVDDPGRSIASVVERDPIAILGNSLVMRVGAGAFLGIDGHQNPNAAYHYYYDSQVRSEPLRVSLPTEGLYAQALMDKCNACEEHSGTTDWVLADKDPELEALADQLGTRRAAPENLTPTAFPASIIALQNAPNAPDPQGLAGVLGAVTSADSFRDMAGLAGTQANAAAAMQTAASLATNFGNQAAALQLAKSKQAADQLDKQRAALERSVGSGIISKEDAGKHLNALHEQAAGGSAVEAPAKSSDDLVNSVAAGLRPGQSGTAARTTADGIETVSVDGSAMLAANNVLIDTLCGFPAEHTVVAESDMRDMLRIEAENERLAWIDPVTHKLLNEGADSIFGRLVVFWITAKSAIPSDTLALITTAALAPGQGYGVLVDPLPTAAHPHPTAAEVTAAVTQARNDLLANVPQPTVPANLAALVDDALRNARTGSLDDDHVAFWSAVGISSFVRRAAIAATVERTGNGLPIGATDLLQPAISHFTFTKEAHKRRFEHFRLGTYHAFTPAERSPQVGDIIIQDRDAGTQAQVLRFRDIPNTNGRGCHSDMIIRADPSEDFVITIGANVDDSVRRRRFPLTADRHLVISPTSDITTEDDDQNLPAVPSNAAGFGSHSTARIFALLSPVENCIDVPQFPARPDGTMVA